MSRPNVVVIEGIRYYEDKPKSCRFCYFWKNRVVGCILGQKNCYYLAEDPQKEKSRCEGCAYGRDFPCLGYCIRELLDSVR